MKVLSYQEHIPPGERPLSTPRHLRFIATTFLSGKVPLADRDNHLKEA